MSRDTDESGAAIPDEWSDREQVLAFAVDVGARVPTGPAEYHGADQSGAFCGFTSALRADRAQIVA